MTCPAPDFSKPTCRVCLQHNENEMYSIFTQDSNNDNLYIYEKIEECTGIKIIRHEKIPSLICKNCFGFLTIAYKFRSICRNSNEYFQEFVLCLPLTQYFQSDEFKKDVKELVNRSNTYKPRMERASSMPPLFKHSNILEVTRSSNGHSDEQNEEFFDEMWLDGEHSDDVNDNKTNLQIISIEKVIINGKEIKNHLEDSNKDDNKATATTPSKTLGISSDGAAVIRDKRPQKSKKTKKEKQPHVCDICGNVYHLRYALESHMRRHRKEKPYECEICGQAFHCNFELTRHIRKHTGSRPYSCSYCQRTFGDRSTLTKHERIHRNERPYKCDTCGKCFTYSSVLKSHLLTHTGEKPYSCQICGKCFSRAHHLRAHLETLQHQNDPLSKILLKRIKRAENGDLQIKVN